MSLTLRATDDQLSLLLKAVWSDGQVNVVEHSRLRKESDQAVADLTGVEDLTDQLQKLQLHADEFVRACMALSKAVYAQNIAAQKDAPQSAGTDLHAELQEQIKLQNAYEGRGTEGLLAADDAGKKVLIDARKALIRAVEYQVAYVVVGAEATVGKLMI